MAADPRVTIETGPWARLERLASLAHGSLRNNELRMACPAHGGSNPDSLKLTVSGGTVLAYCHSNECSWEDICAAVLSSHGVDLRSPGARQTPGQQSVKRVWTYARVSGGPSVEQHELRVPDGVSCGFRRCSDTRAHKHCWQEPKGVGRGGFGLLAHGEPGGVPVVAEGEKTAAAVGSLDGFTGYSYFGGSACAAKADYSVLAGSELVLVAPDNDDAGRKSSRQSAIALHTLGLRVRVLDAKLLPPDKGSDLADVDPVQRLALLNGLLADGVDFAPGSGRSRDKPRPTPADDTLGDAVQPTAVGDAWRVLSLYGPRILLAAPSDPSDRHQVFVLDESTGIWRGGPEPMEFLHCETAKAFAASTAVAMTSGEIDQARARVLLAWAKQTQSTRGAAETSKLLPTAHEQMTRAGAGSLATVVPASDLDPPGRYLGCANGVVDLDSGVLLSPADAAPLLVTVAGSRSYRPSAVHPLVGDMAAHLPAEDRDFVLDALAYALRGTPDRRVNVFAGPPNGGKTTLREAVWSAVGDSLAFALPQTALLQERYPNRNAHDAGMTPMLTHRFAVGSEIPGGATPIDPGRLKTVSGGDSMALREPNEKHRRNRPASATVFLCLNTHNEGSNDLDRLPLHDSAVRDRVQLVCFPEVPGQRDPSVLRRLRSRSFGEAMLAFLVSRCSGLSEPPPPPDSSVRFLRSQYERALGPVGEWVMRCLRLSGSASDWVWADSLHDSLSDWLSSVGERPFDSRAGSLSEIKKFIALPRQVKRQREGRRGWSYEGLVLSEPDRSG